MMRTLAAAMLLTTAALVGCSTTSDPSESAHATVAYHIKVEASEPGVTIETNNVYAGKTPLRLQVFGDKNAAFRNVGSPEFVVHAVPLSTNQFAQTQTFSTGNKSTPGDHIPGLIFFDMHQPGGSFTIDLMPED
jgi:hypothetical protein